MGIIVSTLREESCLAFVAQTDLIALIDKPSTVLVAAHAQDASPGSWNFDANIELHAIAYDFKELRIDDIIHSMLLEDSWCTTFPSTTHTITPGAVLGNTQACGVGFDDTSTDTYLELPFTPPVLASCTDA